VNVLNTHSGISFHVKIPQELLEKALYVSAKKVGLKFWHKFQNKSSKQKNDSYNHKLRQVVMGRQIKTVCECSSMGVRRMHAEQWRAFPVYTVISQVLLCNVYRVLGGQLC
jgi:hypothetical protein